MINIIRLYIAKNVKNFSPEKKEKMKNKSRKELDRREKKTKVYHASSRSAMIPPGFCNRK